MRPESGGKLTLPVVPRSMHPTEHLVFSRKPYLALEVASCSLHIRRATSQLHRENHCRENLTSSDDDIDEHNNKINNLAVIATYSAIALLRSTDVSRLSDENCAAVVDIR